MKPWHHVETWQTSPRAFWGLTAVCGFFVCALVTLSLVFAPTPQAPVDRLPEGAVLALSLPPNTTLRDAAFTAWELEPEAAESLLSFYMREQTVSQALESPVPSVLVLFAPTTSGTAQFVLSLEPQAEEQLMAGLARAYPASRAYPLPDGSVAEELIYDPESAEKALIWDQEALRLRFSTAHTPFYILQTDDAFVFSTIVPQQPNSPVLPICLRGRGATVPADAIQRIDRRFLHFFPLILPSHPIPLFLTDFSTRYAYRNKEITLKNHCNSKVSAWLSPNL